MLRIIVIAALLALTPSGAQAYIDPNAGGMIFQILAPLSAAVATLWLFAKERIAQFFQRIRLHFRRK